VASGESPASCRIDSVRRVAMAEVPLPYAKPLETAALPSAEAVTTAVHETLRAVGRRVA
jgi:pyruvate dehydrogenase E1 component beta subunit